MENGLLISKQNCRIITAFYEEGIVRGFQVEHSDKKSVLGNIYVGKVQNIVKNIHAAFVEFQKGMTGYLSLDDSFLPIHTDGAKDENRVLIGDEIIVQIKKEAIKTKPPTLSGSLELTGKYLILTGGKRQICVSKKIQDKEKRTELKKLLEGISCDFPVGFICRTNCIYADIDAICEEAMILIQQYRDIVVFGKHKSKHSLLFEAPPAYLECMDDFYLKKDAKIITDSAEIYEKILQEFSTHPWKKTYEVSLWNEENGKMTVVHNMERALKRAMQEKVWLKSGAYLVIQPTEALVSIDVNTGKAISKKKDAQATFLKCNMEAAREIAYQIRLRNLSGIIIVDFIDLKEEDDRQTLLKELKEELKKDPIPTRLIDMTPLGLVEITRKKVRKSLEEQWFIDESTEDI